MLGDVGVYLRQRVADRLGRAAGPLLGEESRSEVAQQRVALLLRLHRVQLRLPLADALLRLGRHLLGLRHDLVEKSHRHSTLPERRPPSGPFLSSPIPMFLRNAFARLSIVIDWRIT